LEKNIYFVLDAFAKIAAQLDGVDLIIAGDGPEREGLLAYARELGVAERCHFLGYIDHKAVFTAYSVAKLIVFASKTETQGLSLLEGLSVGRPAVCLDASGVSDILAQNQGGFLTKEDPDEFSSVCVRLLTDSDLYKIKAADAYRRATDFSDENMTARLLDVYAQTIATYHPTKRSMFDD
jgi:1,2-diacylglycerol 3-alpha-glucosyltransferase